MIDDASRTRLEALNTDHHRRMDENYRDLQHRGKLAEVLDHDTRSRASLVQAMKNCTKRFGMPETGRVLELGAGSGRDIDYLVTELAGGDASQYNGVEIVREAAGALRHRGVRHLAIEELPEAWTGCFSFIYSRHVMEHVISLDAALSALKRVLAPDGVIGAVTPHVFPDPEPAHVTKQTAEEWMAHYRRHGLRPLYCPILPFACPECHLVAVHDDYPLPPGIA